MDSLRLQVDCNTPLVSLSPSLPPFDQPLRADARANLEAVLVAAERLIAERGADVPMSAVATEAGVGIATLYRRFPDREQLLLAVAWHFRDKVAGILDAAVDLMQTDPAAGWSQVTHDLARLRPGALIPQLASSLLTERTEDQVNAVRGPVVARIDEVIDQARAAGLVRPDLTAVRFMLGLAAVTRPQPQVRLPELTDQEQWMLEVYLDGLAARAH